MISIASQKLKRIRKRSGLQVDDICKGAKLSYDEYMDLEHDKADEVKRELIDRLCKVLKCRDTDILKG